MSRATLVVEGTVWWAVLVGVWLLTLTTVTLPELVVAAVAAVPCAGAATAARAAYRASWRPGKALVRSLPLVPMEVVRELVRGPSDGTVREVPVTESGVATVVLSLSPGTVVLDDDDGTLTIHATDEQTRLERVWRDRDPGKENR